MCIWMCIWMAGLCICVVVCLCIYQLEGEWVFEYECVAAIDVKKKVQCVFWLSFLTVNMTECVYVYVCLCVV